MSTSETRPSTTRTWQVGGVRITRILESEMPTPGPFLLAEATPERLGAYAWLRPHFVTDDGAFLAAIQAFVIESGGRRIVVDTCIGNDKQRVNPFWSNLHGPFLADLAAAGFPRETIDTVVCTHLHVDHVGWNTMLVEGRWVPTFPRARYLVARAEWAHWSAHPDAGDAAILDDSVRPILDAGLADLIEPPHRLTDEVVLEPTPGHTPGHVSVRIRSEGAEAVITGDLMHHPVQCAEPDWPCLFDVDADAARATRRAFLAAEADRPVLVFGTHFAAPTAGRVVRDGAAWRFVV